MPISLPPRPLNLDDYEAAAKQRHTAAVYDYYASGADDELTLSADRTDATDSAQTSRPIPIKDTASGGNDMAERCDWC